MKNLTKKLYLHTQLILMESKFQIHSKFKHYKIGIQSFIDNFDTQGKTIYQGSRNELKCDVIKDIYVNIKRFQIPNWVNQFAYRWIRSSKAKRSFTYANTLLERNVNTPDPIAYQENYSFLGLLNSYYISIQLDYDFTFRELTYQPNFPDREKIIRDFTRFTYHFQEKGIFFIDHSPGNTLIKKRNGKYEFYLVDLNRMKFKNLSFYDQIKNFARLTPDREIYVIIADEFAKITNKNSIEVLDLMWEEVKIARKKMEKKQAFKKKLCMKKSNYQ